MNDLARWKMRWQNAGAAVIPVWANGKNPVCPAWNVTSPVAQWQEVGGADFRGNIGILPGAELLCVDVDSPPTETNVKHFLAGLGVSAPYERTPNGGAHFWLPVKNAPEALNVLLLSPKVGKGELRTRRANVVVSCSTVGGKRYHFEHGGPEDFAKLRAVGWADLCPLAGGEPTGAPLLAEPPVALLRRAMPAKAAELFAELRGAEKGRPCGAYASRSEAEAAVVASLILAGFAFADIGAAFTEWQPGHFREYPERHKGKYLLHTYQKVLTALAQSQPRQSLAADYAAALASPWPGRGGQLERLVYCGLVSMAWGANRREFNAAELDLAQLCAASRQGVHNALLRLTANRRVLRVERADRWKSVATTFLLLPLTSRANTTPLYCDVSPFNALVELWGRGALGRTAGEVYGRLGAGPQFAGELAGALGRGRRAVFYALKALAAVGLADREGGGWRRGAADVAAVAADFNANERASLRRARTERQRENFRELTSIRKVRK